MNIAATAINLFLDASQLGSSPAGGANCSGASQDPLAGIVGQLLGGSSGSSLGAGIGSLLGVAGSIAGMLA